MTGEYEGVLGRFGSADALAAAVRHAQDRDMADVEVFLPMGDRTTVDAVLPPASRVRGLSLGGGIAGGLLGLAMCIWMSEDYPLVTGGKPIVSLPPFLVIAFEIAILLASFGAIAGLLWFARLPGLTPSAAYRQSFGVDTFGLLIRSVPTPEDQARAARALQEAGALEVEEVRREDRGVLGEVPW